MSNWMWSMEWPSTQIKMEYWMWFCVQLYVVWYKMWGKFAELFILAQNHEPNVPIYTLLWRIILKVFLPTYNTNNTFIKHWTSSTKPIYIYVVPTKIQFSLISDSFYKIDSSIPLQILLQMKSAEPSRLKILKIRLLYPNLRHFRSK